MGSGSPPHSFPKPLVSKIRFPQDLARFSLSYASGEKPPGPAVVVMKSYRPEATHSTLDKDADAKRKAPVAEKQNKRSPDSAALRRIQFINVYQYLRWTRPLARKRRRGRNLQRRTVIIGGLWRNLCKKLWRFRNAPFSGAPRPPKLILRA